MRHLNVGPLTNWHLAPTGIPSCRLDGGKDHKQMIKKFQLKKVNIYFK